MIWGVILEVISWVLFDILWAIIKSIYDGFRWIINLIKTVIFAIFSEISEKKEKKNLGTNMENSNGEENIIDVINASKTRDEDVFKLLVGFSATLISGFILAVILLWLFFTMNGEVFGFSPPQSLVTWEDEYLSLIHI